LARKPQVYFTLSIHTGTKKNRYSSTFSFS